MLPQAGIVGAGGSVYQFPQSERVPVKTALPVIEVDVAKKLIRYTVSGCSLEGDRICDGDILICTTDFERSDILPDDVCIVLIYNSELLAKHVVFQPDGKVGLYSHRAGGGFDKIEVEAGDFEAIAIVTDTLIPRKRHRLG